MNWDDLRVVLAIARRGTLSAAAKDLGVTHSTMSRRLAAVESSVGARLFERLPNGYEPTAEGRGVIDAALRVETEIQHLDRKITGADARLSGTVRLTTVDLLAVHLAPSFTRFRRRYPGVDLVISVDNARRNLAKREADIALRVSRDSPPENLIGRRLARVDFALYAARSLLEETGSADLEALPWMGWDASVAATVTERWMQAHVPGARTVARVDSTLVMVESIRSGLGIGFLACFEGESDPSLVRLRSPNPEFAMQLWLLTHPDLRSTARVRACLDHLEEALRPLAPRFAPPHLTT